MKRDNRDHLRRNLGKAMTPSDVVMTPPSIAKAIVARFSPSGRVLDPCAGEGAFRDAMPGCEWAELSAGRDFFGIRGHFDWIVSNPPFSILDAWLDHSFEVADEIVYLLPVAKVYGSRPRMMKIAAWGGVREVWCPWSGRSVGFPFGWAVGAFHFSRGYNGPTAFDLRLAA